MNKLTRWALEWHKDCLSDSRVLDNVKDDVIYEILEEYGIELNDHDEAKLEMLMRSIIDDNIDWDILAQADEEARDYDDAKRGAIWGR